MKSKDLTPVSSYPSWFNLLGESRSVMEWGSRLVLPKMAHPSGDGHAVLVIPGLFSPDAVTSPLRARLTQWGYDARPWGLGFNWGPRKGVVQTLVRRIRDIHNETGQPVSLVGWSMGGSLAYVAATRLDKEVRSVITLGSPLRSVPGVSRITGLFEAVSGFHPNGSTARRWARKLPRHPVTSIISRHDGIIAEHAAVAPEGPRCETVYVPATHLGMPANPCVLHVLSDRLAQPAGTWHPFSVESASWPLRAAWALS